MKNIPLITTAFFLFLLGGVLFFSAQSHLSPKGEAIFEEATPFIKEEKLNKLLNTAETVVLKKSLNRREKGTLHQFIGNILFQLNQYSLSLYHFEQAKQLMPRNSTIETNLHLIREKLNIKSEKNPALLSNLFFFHYLLSVGERLFIFSICSWLLLLSLSFWIRFRGRWKQLSILIAAITFLFGSSLLVTKYFEPQYGILTQASFLLQGAGKDYQQVEETPLRAGEKVRVLNIGPEGEWAKILDTQNTIGFINTSSLRIITK